MICPACAAWISPLVDRESRRLQCPECGHRETYTTFPLFIVIGASSAASGASALARLHGRLYH